MTTCNHYLLCATLLPCYLATLLPHHLTTSPPHHLTTSPPYHYLTALQQLSLAARCKVKVGLQLYKIQDDLYLLDVRKVDGEVRAAAATHP